MRLLQLDLVHAPAAEGRALGQLSPFPQHAAADIDRRLRGRRLRIAAKPCLAASPCARELPCRRNRGMVAGGRDVVLPVPGGSGTRGTEKKLPAAARAQGRWRRH